MNCPRCQAAMADNVVFCTTCGTAVGAAEQAPAGSSSMTQPAQPGYRPSGQPDDSQPAQPPGQPGYHQPGSPPPGQPGYAPPAQPGYAPPGQPGYAPRGQPGYSQPAQPGYPPGQPGARQPTQPGYPPPGQPGYAPPGQPGYAPPGQPGYAPQGQPSYSPPAQPGYRQPAQPGYAAQGQPGYSQPAQPGYAPPGQPGYQPGYGPPGYSPHGQPGYGPPGQPGYFPPAPHAAPAFAFDLKRLSGAEQVIGGACAVLIITLFLPWFGISGDGISVTASGFSAHGYLVIALLTAVALIAYLVMRAGWADPPVKLPVAPMPLLLATTGLQLLIVLIAFLVKPAFTSWQFGAYLGLLTALVACAAAAVPAIGSMQGSRPGS